MVTKARKFFALLVRSFVITACVFWGCILISSFPKLVYGPASALVWCCGKVASFCIGNA